MMWPHGGSRTFPMTSLCHHNDPIRYRGLYICLILLKRKQTAPPGSGRELEADPVRNLLLTFRQDSLDQPSLLSNLMPSFPEGQKTQDNVFFLKVAKGILADATIVEKNPEKQPMWTSSPKAGRQACSSHTGKSTQLRPFLWRAAIFNLFHFTAHITHY